MHLKQGLAWVFGAAPLLLGAPAFSDDVPVNITNDGTDAIMVTVYDTSVRPHVKILSQRVNGFATVPVNVSSDSTGRANIAWTAVTVDPNERKCGHAARPGLGTSSAVTVNATEDCGAVRQAVRNIPTGEE
jgi:hypothetical protein